MAEESRGVKQFDGGGTEFESSDFEGGGKIPELLMSFLTLILYEHTITSGSAPGYTSTYLAYVCG